MRVEQYDFDQLGLVYRPPAGTEDPLPVMVAAEGLTEGPMQLDVSWDGSEIPFEGDRTVL